MTAERAAVCSTGGATAISLIVLVEDQSFLRSMLERYLEHRGYAIISFACLSDVRSGISPGTEVDAVVTDYVLPDSTGFEVIAHVRRLSNRLVPAIVMTGWELAHETLPTFTDQVAKPFDPSELSGKLRDLAQAFWQSEAKRMTQVSHVGYGSHVLHLHASEADFAATMGVFVGQGVALRAKVQYNLPEHLESVLQSHLSTWRESIPGDLTRLHLTPDAERVRAEVIDAVTVAADEGYDGLWLVLFIPEVFREYELWRRVEPMMSELCRSLPLTVICPFPARGDHVPERLQEMCCAEFHDAYFSAPPNETRI